MSSFFIIAFCIAFISAWAVSFPCCMLIRICANRWGWLDQPGVRKIHSVPIPTGGGIGIACGVIVPFALGLLALLVIQQNPGMVGLFPESLSVHFDGILYRSARLWTLLGLACILLLLGLLDDRYNLNWKIRIAVQTLVAVMTVRCGWSLTIFIDIPFLTGIISVLWIVGLINAFNMLDNMNGLSAGVAAICASFLALVMFLSPNPQSDQPQFFIGGLLIVLVGAIAGFLCHNNPFRAKLFMGDAGAYFIGFLLAASTLSATFSGYDRAPQTIFVPLLILAVPLYDMISVILIRLKNGKSPFEGDKNHFSHRLVQLGLSRPQAVLTVYLTTIICCIGAILLYQVTFAGACLIFLQTVAVLSLIAIMEYAWRKNESDTENESE